MIKVFLNDTSCVLLSVILQTKVRVDRIPCSLVHTFIYLTPRFLRFFIIIINIIINFFLFLFIFNISCRHSRFVFSVCRSMFVSPV